MTLRIGVAGIPGAWSTERLGQTLGSAGVDALTFSLADCTVELPRGGVWWEGQDLGRLDAVIVKKLGVTTDPLTPARVHLLHQLEARGVRVFSPARAIAEANDRYRMTLRLSDAGIPIPRTFVADTIDAAAEVIHDWGRVVVKPLFTSKGRGMLLVGRGEAHRLALRRWQRRWRMPFYLQEYLPGAGKDIGVVVLGVEVLGAYYRVARPDVWLTTTAAGGRYEVCPVTPEMARLAVRAATLFGLTFTCVDLVAAAGGYLAYEVSAFGGFAGLWQTQGIDAADLYAKHVVRIVHALAGSPAHERAGLGPSYIPA